MRSKGLGVWLDRLAYGLFLCGVVGAAGMTVLVFVSTLSRYLFNAPWHFANELTGLLFFSLTFLTIPHVLNQGDHIRLDLLTRRLPAGLARIAEALAALILLLFAAILLYESWDFMSVSYGLAARTEIGGLLLWPWMALMPLSFLLCILIQLRHGLSAPDKHCTGEGEP